MSIRMRNSAAFSMMEIMVVIFIIGILAATLGPRVVKYMGKGEQTEIKLRLTNIKNALNEYRMALGQFPSSREGLRALIENPRPNDERYRRVKDWPFLEGGEDSLSKAGIEFIYNSPPVRFKNKGYKYYEVIYPGPSGDDEDPAMQEVGA